MIVYRPDHENFNAKNKNIILIDDGIATGATTEVAIIILKKQKASKIILAIPTMPEKEITRFKKLVDELIYINAPDNFFGVGQFYQNFSQTSDEEVINLMKQNLNN